MKTAYEIPPITDDGQVIEFPTGYSLVVRTPFDDDMGPPWKEHDCHGVVSDWTSRPKRPGERILHSDRSSRLYYDVEASMEIARRDGWGLLPEELAALEAGRGRPPTRGEITAQAVENDFDHLRGWCNGEWYWIGVVVTLRDPSGLEVDSESLWGIESDTDYWQTVAHELADVLVQRHLDSLAYARDAESLHLVESLED